MKTLRMLIVLLCLALGTGTILPAAAQGGEGVQVFGGTEQEVRSFLARLVAWQSAPDQTADIFIGALPADLPLAIPLPQDARLLGSITQTVYTARQFIILVDTALPAPDVIAFFDAALAGEWRAINAGPPGGGFVEQPIYQSNYCHASEDALLYASAQTVSGGVTSLRLLLQLGNTATVCSQLSAEQIAVEAYSLLPQLTVPAGATIVGGRSGGSSIGPRGESFASTSATLQAAMPASALMDDYTAQLEDLGWLLVRTDANGAFAWSAWTFLDQTGSTWTATLTLTADPLVENEFMALLWIRAAA
ncbi:MAG: hypothetical protein JW910_20130 [Anaerolineae bacterium]|nr:hypothetical protein [Anaerolineae bacterium]